MAIGHAVRGASAAALTLIVIEAVGSDRTGKVGSFFADVSRLLALAVSPDVPLIRDRRGSSPGTSSYITPAQAAAAVKTANGAAAVGAVTAPGGLLDGLPSLGQYVSGGGLPGLTATPR